MNHKYSSSTVFISILPCHPCLCIFRRFAATVCMRPRQCGDAKPAILQGVSANTRACPGLNQTINVAGEDQVAGEQCCTGGEAGC
ncbi:beta-d-xylosidase 1 [Nicotiana attenuata]|uniref:Beta-d-xylosidase 1 n=1 Tax=Nicotiana attenuata TaxID=49451 RepID=A0A314LEF9_NICAT|nr:beta-d-xylosidase 1 [Nicotiana attenuata]